MAKDRVTFICGECGYESAKWMGKCPQCESWNTMTEFAEVKVKSASAVGTAVSQKLSKVVPLPQKRISAGMGELNRVLGGGLIRGMVVLLGGDPGIGKSTLLLQAADTLASEDSVLYVSGEESASQIKMRADRLGMKNDIDILCETDLDQILDEASNTRCGVLIVDSIQTIVSEESAGRAGERKPGARGDRAAHALRKGNRRDRADRRTRHQGRKYRGAACAGAYRGHRAIF